MALAHIKCACSLGLLLDLHDPPFLCNSLEQIEIASTFPSSGTKLKIELASFLPISQPFSLLTHIPQFLFAF